MANLIDVSALTVNPQEVTEVANVIQEKVFIISPLSEDHEIEIGINMKTQIAFVNQLAGGLTRAVGCAPDLGTGLTMSQKYWEPEMFAKRWEHCAAEMNGLVKLFNKAVKINPDFYDALDSDELKLVIAAIAHYLEQAIPQLVWFSDKAAAITPAGTMSTGTNLAEFNVINGLFKQIFAEVNATTGNYVAVAQNGQATYVLQTLPADAAFDLLTKVVEKADGRLLADPTAKILVTRSISDNYRATLRTKNLNNGYLDVAENGRPILRFDGYELKVRDDWDREIKASFNSGTKLDKPHRILFTTPSNIPICTTNLDDFGSIDSKYDAYKKVNFMDVALRLDAKFLEGYMAVAAY